MAALRPKPEVPPTMKTVFSLNIISISTSSIYDNVLFKIFLVDVHNISYGDHDDHSDHGDGDDDRGDRAHGDA